MAKIPQRFIDFDAAAVLCEGEDVLTRALRDGQLTGWFRELAGVNDVRVPQGAWDELRSGIVHVGGGMWRALDLEGEPSGTVMVERAALDQLLSPGTAKSGTKGGRPEQYDWNEFWVEVAMVADTPDGLPDSQADLVRHMADWCETNWGEQPSDSTLKSRLKPLYDKRKARRPSGQ